ncbi:type VII secretion integral membrane protein EccD [Micromonospora zingiberis]|uniref:type VII secretion integral membrane protein EccD n=1 Tax=Micromonospora zingiberis TaxID=2053011 RepID=UPI0013F46A03|nr:type VII secretion integral membrane protein EccD [Micromonospora zingiberis]
MVHGPERRLEVAVPAEVPIADLFPALLRHLGDNVADAGLAHGGWVLQRLGAPPLDEDSSVAALGLRDGETLHLRPRSEQIPPVHFDDLADGIATGVRSRSGLWRPEMIRWSGLGVLVVLLVIGIFAVALPGPPLSRTLAASVLSLICLAGALGFSRAAADRTFGLVTVFAGIGYAGLAGGLAPAIARDSAVLESPAPQLFAGAVAVAVTALLAVVIVGRVGPATVAVASAALYAAAGAGLCAYLGLSAEMAAAVIAVLATVLTVLVPMTAFRLARIRLAPLPTEPEHLQEEIDPEPSEVLLAQTARADHYMTGLYAGNGIAAAVSVVLLAVAGWWVPWTLLALVAVVRLLALRPMTSAWHRLTLAGPALLGLALLGLLALAGAAPLVRLAVVVIGLPVAAVSLFWLGRELPDRRIMPYWGRIGDVAQLVSTVAMFPVLLAVLGVYGAARALGG